MLNFITLVSFKSYYSFYFCYIFSLSLMLNYEIKTIVVKLMIVKKILLYINSSGLSHHPFSENYVVTYLKISREFNPLHWK